jgi:hypothetical protein
MNKIIDNVVAKSAQVKTDAKEAEAVKKLCVAAIKSGIRSKAWKAYMLKFLDKDSDGNVVSPAQLARLLATDGTLDDDPHNVHRAYLVGNFVCTAASTGGGQGPPSVTCAMPGFGAEMGGPPIIGMTTTDTAFGVESIDLTIPELPDCSPTHKGTEGTPAPWMPKPS